MSVAQSSLVTPLDSTHTSKPHMVTMEFGGIKYIMKLHNSHTQQAVFNNLIYSEFWKKVVGTWCNLCNEVATSVKTNDDILCKPLFLNDEFGT